MAASISVLIPYANYLHDQANLKACLASLARQTRQPKEVLLLDDSHPDEQEANAKLAQAYGLTYLAFPFVNYAPAFGRKLNTGAAVSTGDIICLLCSNWVMDSEWMAQMADWLETMGPGNLATGNSDRAHWFQDQVEPVEIGVLSLWDSGFLTMLYRQDWQPWDEGFDPAPGDMTQTRGAWHAITEWDARLQQAGMRAWAWNKPQATHLYREESDEWQTQVRWSEQLLHAKGVQ